MKKIISSALILSLMGTNVGWAHNPQPFLEDDFATTPPSKAALSLINNQGDPSKTLKNLGRKENIRSFAFTVATAGVIEGITQGIGGSVKPEAAGYVKKPVGLMEEIGEHLEKHFTKAMINTAVSTPLSALIQNQKLEDALEQGLRGVAANSVGGVAASTIGDARGSIDFLTHKVLHAATGAVMGAISSKKWDSGALSGAIGAIVAETIAETITPAPQELEQHLVEEARKEGRTLTSRQLREGIDGELRKRADMARLVSGSLALAIGQDADVAIHTATNAVENNFWLHSLLGGMDVDGVKRDVDKFINLTTESIESFREEGRELGEALADVLTVKGLPKECLEKAGKSIGLGVGIGINAVGLMRGKTVKVNPQARSMAPPVRVKKGSLPKGRGVPRKPEGTNPPTLPKIGHGGGTPNPKIPTTHQKISPNLKQEPGNVGQGGRKGTGKSNPPLRQVPPAELKTPKNASKKAEATPQTPNTLNAPKEDKVFKSAPLDAEGRWPVKIGKEWRGKIVGRGQETGKIVDGVQKTYGHRFRSYREAITAAKRDDVKTVYLNRGYKKATGEPVCPNRRPDVTIVRKDGRVDAIEVRSTTDKPKILRQRNDEVMKQLPPEKQGKIRVIEPTKIKPTEIKDSH